MTFTEVFERVVGVERVGAYFEFLAVAGGIALCRRTDPGESRGAELVVSELSRLGRSMLECMEILSVAAQKRINVYSVKGAWRLDQSIQSKIIAMAFSMAAEIERDLISQRTKEALRFKKAQGMKLGRPTGPGKSKLDPYRPEIESLLANGSTQKFIARRYLTTEANLHNWLKKHGLKLSKDLVPVLTSPKGIHAADAQT